MPRPRCKEVCSKINAQACPWSHRGAQSSLSKGRPSLTTFMHQGSWFRGMQVQVIQAWDTEVLGQAQHKPTVYTCQQGAQHVLDLAQCAQSLMPAGTSPCTHIPALQAAKACEATKYHHYC